jgi:hypothetical protein
MRVGLSALSHQDLSVPFDNGGHNFDHGSRHAGVKIASL